jgi:rhodanese-related sulfurtransferase
MISIKHLASLSCAALLLFAGAKLHARSQSDPANIDVTEAERLLKADAKIIVLDVRTPEEFAAGRIAGAVNMDFHDADFKKKLAALDKDKTYLVHCASGRRSAKTRNMMRTRKFKSIYHLEGGIKAWEQAGKPVAR